MKYHPEYFDFSKLKFYNEMIDIGITLFTIYTVIFLVSYVYSKFPPAK